MSDKKVRQWQLSRHLSISEVVQLVLLGTLIVGSWVNLQCQLDLLGRDVSQILHCQKDFQVRIENMQITSIKHEYRLRAVENKDVSIGQNDKSF